MPQPIQLKIKQLPHAYGLPLPRYMTEGAAGMDIPAAVTETVTLEPGEYKAIPTGLQVAVPPGYELQIRPRSGLALHRGIGLLNSPGTVDADYRGEIKVILINLSREKFQVRRGERIAQMVLCPAPRVETVLVEELESTAREEGGFGHTGL